MAACQQLFLWIYSFYLQCCGRAHSSIILRTTKFTFFLVKSMNKARRMLLNVVVLLNKCISNLKPKQEIQSKSKYAQKDIHILWVVYWNEMAHMKVHQSGQFKVIKLAQKKNSTGTDECTDRPQICREGLCWTHMHRMVPNTSISGYKDFHQCP